MRIAVVFTGSVNNRKGLFNNVIERIRYLRSTEGVELDVFLIQHTYGKIFKHVAPSKDDFYFIDDIKVRNLWVHLSAFEYLVTHKLKINDIACKSQMSQYASLFKKFDLLSVHGLLDLHLASIVKEKYQIPFVMTWHGSDIHKYPWTSKKVFNSVKAFLEKADYNFFVSKNLQAVSDRIVKVPNKDYLYSGASEAFYQKTTAVKELLRENLNVHSTFLIGFIGNMKPIKNVMILPDIFRQIKRSINEVGFIVVGDGPLLDSLKREIDRLQISDVTFLGNTSPERVPDIMGSLDILLLPSLNEGLPRVTLEALQCGVHVVGSSAGGIPEVVGEENCFDLDDNLAYNISKRVISIIKNREPVKQMSDDFSWNKTIHKEVSIYNSIVKKNNNYNRGATS